MLCGNEVYLCSKCGKETEWDEDMGQEPLCVVCWDGLAWKMFEDKAAAARKAYREANKDKVAAAKC